MDWLLVLLFTKHLLADFPLQTPWMLRKGQLDGWELPLLAHSAVHAAMTAIVLWAASRDAWLSLGLAAFELVVHFCVDRLKAHPRLGGRWPISQPQFWWALGADQWAHAMTYLWIAHRVAG